ncbi:peptidyl-tRNA hydrolase [Populus alba x Populus x berolinensis]|uniref:peptidyl-tRNA hydrolase n=1 Tax=Populus alba x Populus x berolinensis TaxID=444605 RepID=A0AAD6M2L0_9ROSI|nr:peptidyl-tRNA hydrolase [Populus alba x Populus x berolinensis]
MKLGSTAVVVTSSSVATLGFPKNYYNKPSWFGQLLKTNMFPHNFPILSSSSSSASISTTTEDSSDAVAAAKPKQQQPWLIVGLGNPGKKYHSTRHNVGFQMVDALADAEGISISGVSLKALFGKGFIGNVPVMFAKPQTFMNASGESVGAIVSYYKIPLKQVLLIYDDLDLPFAKLRLLPKGGHGGHNGYLLLLVVACP